MNKLQSYQTKGWQYGLEVRTLASNLLSLGPEPAINCHPGVSQAGWFINVSPFSWMDVKWVSHLPAFVGGSLRCHGVLWEECVSYCLHHEQIPNSCPNQQRALHQWQDHTLSQWCYPAALCWMWTKKNHTKDYFLPSLVTIPPAVSEKLQVLMNDTPSHKISPELCSRFE